MSSSCNCWAAGVLPAVFLFSYSPAVAVEAGVAREVRSPDGKIGITIHTDAPLGYSIAVDGKVVLARSRLGLELADKVSLGEHPVLRARSGNPPILIGKTRSARTATCGIITTNWI